MSKININDASTVLGRMGVGISATEITDLVTSGQIKQAQYDSLGNLRISKADLWRLFLRFAWSKWKVKHACVYIAASIVGLASLSQAYENLLGKVPLIPNQSGNVAGKSKGDSKSTSSSQNLLDEHAPQVIASYMRLFGAFQVPALLEDQYPGDTNTPFSAGTNRVWWNKRFPNTNLFRAPIWNDVREAFNTTDKESRLGGWKAFTKSSFWDMAFGDDTQRALKEIDDFYGVSTLMERAPTPEEVKTQTRAETYLKEHASRVGYLFLLLDWKPKNSNVSEAKFYFRRFSVPFGKKTSPSEAEVRLQSAPLEFLWIPVPPTPAKQLCLVSVYEKDAKGYAKVYRSSVIKPECIVFEHTGKRQTIPIRKPYLDKAAKIEVPLGWYSQ